MNIRLFSGRTSHSVPPRQSTVQTHTNEAAKMLARDITSPAGHRDGQQTLLRRQALNSAQQGKLAEAIALLNDVIAHHPTSADYNNRGLLHFQNGQPDVALDDYNRALQIDPGQAKIYNNRANCYVALGQLAEAIDDYETAIDLDPANINAWINQGITFRDLEMYPQAIENFDLALGFSQISHEADEHQQPTSLEGHIYAERGRAHHLTGDWNYAVADYQRALSALPDHKKAADVSGRLSLQVQTWLDDLLKPLLAAER